MSRPGAPDRAPAHGPRLEVLRHLDADELHAVAVLVEDVTETDGVRPLSEHATLHLRHGGDTEVRHLLLWVEADDDGADSATGSATGSATDDAHGLAGYLHLDVTDAVEGSSAELAVRPSQRGRGFGRVLVARALTESPDGRLRLWAHGEHSASRALAASMGFTRMRTLWQMRRSLYGPLASPVAPPGVRFRTFVPGADDEAWVALNALAFATHPEQGSYTLDDLHERMAEPWFDPAGFFLAERDGRLVGFHWTKVHGGLGLDEHDHAHLHEPEDEHEHPHGHGHGHEPVGEVYVLGVHPDEHGRGLGKALTLLGLQHLRSAGLPAAMLYVEADNAAAIGLYSGLGFTHWDTDVMFRSGDGDRG